MFDEAGFAGDPDEDAAAPILYTFVYCSRAADGVDDAEVDRLIAAAQAHNRDHGITGVLTFGSGVFFQWIEGPTAEVTKLVANLHGDPRHYDIVTLDQSEEQRDRLYPDWQMERVAADDIREVLHDALDTAEDDRDIGALTRILAHLDTKSLDTLGRE